MTTATIAAEVQTRIDALTHPTPAAEILQNAVDTVGLSLDLTNIVSVLNSATSAITGATPNDDITALNAASIALGVTSKDGGNGGVPIKGIQEFYFKIDDDYAFQDQRFLRQGVVETDQAKFDISIWDKKAPLPYGYLDSPAANPVAANNYSLCESDGTLYLSIGTQTIVSEDNGVTWEVRNGLTMNKNKLLEMDDGKIVWINTGNNNGQLYYTTDKGLTASLAITTGTGLLPEGIVTDGVRVVVMSDGVWRYSTNAALTTWGNCTGAELNPVAADKDITAYGNGVWLMSPATGGNSKDTNRSLDGITWAYTANVFTTTSHVSGALMFDSFAGLFRKFGEVGQGLFKMWTSADGLTWSNPVDVDLAGLDAFGSNMQNNSEGVLFMQMNSPNNPIIMSQDGGVTWGILPLQSGTTQNYAVSNVTGNIHIADNVEIINCNYDYYAGAYFAYVTSATPIDNEISASKFVRIS